MRKSPKKLPTRPRRHANPAARRLDALTRALGDLVYDWRPRENRVDWRGDSEAVLGYTAGEMGKTTAGWAARVHPDDFQRVLDEVEKARLGTRRYEVEYRFRHRDGHYVWMQDRGALLLDAAGALEGVVGVFRDVTERRRIEEQLRVSERQRRLMVATQPECIKVVNRDGRLVEMNAAGLAMLEADSLEEAARVALTDYVVVEHRAAFAELHRNVIAGGSGTLEFEVVGLKGTRRWLETRAVPLRDTPGGAITLLGITRDVTERRAQRERILRLSRMRGVMSSINALVVRTRNRAELLQDACRILVEEGGFGLAWIGIAQDDGALLPVARHGAGAAMLDELPTVLAHRGGLPTLRALRERTPQVCNDIATDPDWADWRERPLGLGLRSFVACPLSHGGQARGTLNLYAHEPGVFDDEELRLLGELARDIGYGIEFLLKQERLDFLAFHDPLTGLANRGLFVERVGQFIEQSRERNTQLAVVVIDLLRFKAVNDEFGRAVGDEVLKLAAQRLERFAGNPALVARLGGDRFGAVVPDLRDAAELARILQERVWERLIRPVSALGHEVPLAAQLGIAMYPSDGADGPSLTRDAEVALKRAKERGDRWLFYAPEMTASVTERLALETQLRRALEQRQFVLHYQPKVDLRTGAICGAEALLRWVSPGRGLVLPETFVPVLEESGLILEVGRWALEQAALDRRSWLEAQLPPLPVAVNVSTQQLRQADFVDVVTGAMAAAGGPAGGLEIEVTESMLISNIEQSIETLRRLRDRGVPTAIDDFGTGYSSLAYLARLPAGAVKVDRSFVQGMAAANDTTPIVSAVIALAHSMHLKVIAEGVESADQLKFLRLLRCDEMQGYLFSRPVPAAEFAELLRSGRRLEQGAPG